MPEKMLASLPTSFHQKERDYLRNFIEEIKTGTANHFLFNLFATPGFGRTAFLDEIWSEYEEATLPISFVRVNSFKKDGLISTCDLLIHVLQELDFRLSKRVSQLPADYESFTDREVLAEQVVGVFSRAKESEKVILLLLDDYDHLSSDVSRWFERKVLGPLVKTKKVAVVLTSEFELRFTEEFDLRMRLESYELKSWNSDEIAQSFPQYEEIARKIHTITGGMPLLTRGLIQQLAVAKVSTAIDFQSHELQLVQQYHRTLVDENIFQGFSPEMRLTLQALAILRRFDIKILKEILPKVLPESYGNSSTANFLDLIEQLGSRVQWRMQGGYALNDALQLVLRNYALIENPNLYRQVNRTAVVLYRDLLQQEYREHYLMELLYHGLVLLQFAKDAGLSPAVQIGDELLDFLNGDDAAPVQIVELDSLRNSLMRDPDLKVHVSDDVLQEIQRLIRVCIIETDVIQKTENKESIVE